MDWKTAPRNGCFEKFWALDSRFYYVYTHVAEGTVFYVGKGRNTRPFDFWSRTKIWLSAWHDLTLAGLEIQVNIVKSFKVEKEALRYERFLIEKYNPECNQR